MSLFQIFVLTTLTISSAIAIYQALKLRHKITGMHAMTISMIMGMNSGLTGGVLFGSLFQGDLYVSTIISIAIGASVGFVCGIIFGILPSLEGLMAGIMAGMMGAMLGDMITQSQSITIINLLLAFTVSSLLIFNIFKTTDPAMNKITRKSWFFKPILTFIIILTFLLLGSHLEKNSASSNIKTTDDRSKHNHNQQEEIQGKCNEIIVNIFPSEFTYTPSKITIKKNEPVKIILKNQDQIDHDIEIKKIHIDKKTNNHSAEHSHVPSDFHLHASANSTSIQTITPLQNGIYEFYCSIPGHKENGMIGTLVVK